MSISDFSSINMEYDLHYSFRNLIIHPNRLVRYPRALVSTTQNPKNPRSPASAHTPPPPLSSPVKPPQKWRRPGPSCPSAAPPPSPFLDGCAPGKPRRRRSAAPYRMAPASSAGCSSALLPSSVRQLARCLPCGVSGSSAPRLLPPPPRWTPPG